MQDGNSSNNATNVAVVAQAAAAAAQDANIDDGSNKQAEPQQIQLIETTTAQHQQQIGGIAAATAAAAAASTSVNNPVPTETSAPSAGSAVASAAVANGVTIDLTNGTATAVASNQAVGNGALTMFAPDGGNNEETIDLDDLFHECYFGDFPVPPFAQQGDNSNNVVPTPVVSSAPITPAPAPAPTVSTPIPSTSTPLVNNPVANLPQKRKVETTNGTTPNNSNAAQPTLQLPPSIINALSSGASHALTIASLPGNSSSLLPASKKLTDQQKLERRERNREHAKRSRLRKKFLLESLQGQIHGLQSEIEMLKDMIRTELPHKADGLLATLATSMGGGGGAGPGGRFTPLPMPSGFGPVKTLMEPDFRLMSALSNSQQNFAISDPSLPDNPIVYVSQGFLDLTEYTLEQVLGRNCRFLQGPGTDQSAVDVIRKGVRDGIDTSVCLLNYKADGTPFWNQFFVAALRDAQNNVVNFVGVQCEVSKAVVESQIKSQGGATT